MKITITRYSPDWAKQFARLKKEIAEILKDLNPAIEHIGSTSIPGLSAKPVIDIQIGLRSADDFPLVEKRMMAHHYIYYEVFNSSMPNRRLFVRLKGKDDYKLFPKKFTNPENIPHEEINKYRHAHVHVWQVGTSDWNRHLAFRDYLMANPELKQQYEDLKMKLSLRDWKHGMEYNDGKDEFIKRVQVEAVEWYEQLNKAK